MPKTNNSKNCDTSSRTTGWTNRWCLILGIVSYVACFQWMYIHYLYPMWAYFGYDYNPPAAGFLVLAWVLSVNPSFWMPIHLARPSQLAYWVLYIFVFIPSMFVPLYIGFNSPEEISVLMLTFYLGFLIVGSGYVLPLFRIRPVGISARLFWWGFGSLTVILTIWMLVVFRGHLRIVSLQDIYDLRNAASDVAEGSQVNYALMLLIGAINPFLMACGLYHKRRGMFFMGAFGQLLVYSVIGQKSSIASIFFICGFYVLFKVGRLPFALKLVFGTLGLVSILSLSYAMSGENPGLIHFALLALVFQRTLGSGGLLTAQYYDFFQHNPLTHLSNVKGVSWLVHYPYKYPIGEEIGLAYAGSTDLDATAHFWAFDGIGGFGLAGVLLVSILCGLVFWTLDSAAQRNDPRFAALVISFGALNLANISIFTSLLSGGLALLVLSLYLMPPGSIRFRAAKKETERDISTASHGRTLPIQDER
jgi:O-antigen polymerase